MTATSGIADVNVVDLETRRVSWEKKMNVGLTIWDREKEELRGRPPGPCFKGLARSC